MEQVQEQIKPSQWDGLNRERQQQEDERAELRKGPCVIRCSLLLSAALILLGREKECAFLKEISWQTSLL